MKLGSIGVVLSVLRAIGIGTALIEDRLLICPSTIRKLIWCKR
jgi:hypothetical protein